jgi:hypothetical protein
METTKSTINSGSVTEKTLLSFVRELFGGYPDPDAPQPPGPWDPIIREAVKRTAGQLTGLFPFDDYDYRKPPRPNWLNTLTEQPDTFHPVFGPRPEPWRSLLGTGSALLRIIAERHPAIEDIIGGGGPLSRVALNPQPLPPRIAFAAALASEVINQAVVRQELADLIHPAGQERGIIIVSGRIRQFVDDYCVTGKLRWPFPVPPPPWWSEQLSGTSLIVMGVQFGNAAPQVFNEELRQTFIDAGEKLVETGFSRLQ